MSVNYFENPEKRKAWDKELSAMREEKERRQAGKSAGAAVAGDSHSSAEKNPALNTSRVQITYHQLLEREYGPAKPAQLSRSSAKQMEKSKNMTRDIGGKNR